MNSKVRELQRGLYRAAKENRERVFYSLHDKICRPDVLLAAWQKVKANGGAPWIDGVSVEQIEEQGVVDYLKQIRKELREGTYRCKKTRKVEIPKPNGGVRILGVPTAVPYCTSYSDRYERCPTMYVSLSETLILFLRPFSLSEFRVIQ